MKRCVRRKCRERILLPGQKIARPLCLALMVALSKQLLAQTAGEGFSSATKQVVTYFDLGITLMYAIGAVVGIIGAIKVYNKWNSGDQDTGKVAASWFGSCIFLVVVATILKGFFGVS